MRGTEAYEQIAVVDYCDFKHIPIFHIPNGGSRNKREAKNLKRQGVKPGIPDLCIPVAKGGYHGLYIEMKAEGGKPTEKQLEWIELLNANGYRAVICFGFDEARETIDRYMGGK